MGRYATAYRKWIKKPAADKTYNNFKTHFNNEYQIQNDLSTTAKDVGYHGANNVASITPTTSTMSSITPPEDTTLHTAITELAEAQAVERENVLALTDANSHLQGQLAQLNQQNQQLQHMMQMAFTNNAA